MRSHKKEVQILFYVSIATWFVYIIIGLIGYFVPDIGINTLLFRVGIPLSLIVVVFNRIVARETMSADAVRLLKMSYWIALSALIVGVLFVIGIFLFFIPWLFA